MITYLLLAVIFSAAALLTVAAIRSFSSLSLKELKRRARTGDSRSAAVYKLRARFGMELWLLLWLKAGILASLSVLMLTKLLWDWLAILLAAFLLAVAQLVLTKTKRPAGLALAAKFAPPTERVLEATHLILKYPARMLKPYADEDPFWQPASRDELLDVLNGSAELNGELGDAATIARSALLFGDKTIESCMTPASVIKTVSAEDPLSPIIMSELHASGFSRFPVVNGDGAYVGILYLKDAIEVRANKKISEIARPQVYFVNEAARLDSALKAFLKTKHHLFLVVNEYEEVVGLITIEDVIEQVIGHRIVDEFDKYDDLRAVAKSLAEERARVREKAKQTAL